MFVSPRSLWSWGHSLQRSGPFTDPVDGIRLGLAHEGNVREQGSCGRIHRGVGISAPAFPKEPKPQLPAAHGQAVDLFAGPMRVEHLECVAKDPVRARSAELQGTRPATIKLGVVAASGELERDALARSAASESPSSGDSAPTSFPAGEEVLVREGPGPP